VGVDLIQVLTLLVIVGICAAIAQVFFELLVGYVPGNLLTTVIVGILGAYLGSLIPSPWPLSFLNISVGAGVQAITFNLLWTIAGSVLVLLLLYVLPGGKGWRRRPLGRP
jgi:uncharacterized membrane protein YeaQ/YmgE (transglycosylase-associated protein family)